MTRQVKRKSSDQRLKSSQLRQLPQGDHPLRRQKSLLLRHQNLLQTRSHLRLRARQPSLNLHLHQVARMSLQVKRKSSGQRLKRSQLLPLLRSKFGPSRMIHRAEKKILHLAKRLLGKPQPVVTVRPHLQHSKKRRQLSPLQPRRKPSLLLARMSLQAAKKMALPLTATHRSSPSARGRRLSKSSRPSQTKPRSRWSMLPCRKRSKSSSTR